MSRSGDEGERSSRAAIEPAETGFKLIYALGGQEYEVVRNQSRNELGRSPECGVVFPTNVPGVSRHHATISREGDEWHITDEGSRNGTYINKVLVAKLSKQRLRDGDVINLGTLKLEFQLERPGGPSERPQSPREAQSRPEAPDESFDGRVKFDDDIRPEVSVSINLADMEGLLGSGLSGSLGKKKGKLASGLYELKMAKETADSERAWGIQLFSEIGHALLSSSDLNVMLKNIMNLVFFNVPSERGLICLLDEQTQDLIPKYVRTMEGDSGTTISISRSIADLAIKKKNSLLVSDTDSDSRFTDAASVRNLNIKSAMCVPLYNEGRIGGLIYVDTQSQREPFQEEHLEVLTVLALFSAVAVEQARLHEHVIREQQKRARLERYMSPAVVDQIVDRIAAGTDDVSDQMIAEEKDLSILFADLSGFTSLSENLDPSEVVKLLNTIFERLTEAVFQHNGTLDKFMGDGMLAFFGAPLPQPNHAEVSVRAALQMQTNLDEYNRSAVSEKQLGMRIGINSGPMVVGDIGSMNRKDYTVIGDTVNVASRLESAVAKPGQIVIGPATHELVKDLFQCEQLEPAFLKGKKQEVQPYLILGEMAATRTAELADPDV